jgi:predicted aldo/keto reductase-like oxidoreductase
MEKVKFGKTGLMVSRVAFGGIPIMRLSKADAVKVIREAVNLGINFIDTANGYVDSEEKIGEAIKGIKRENIIIASKSMANDKKTFKEHVDLSLKRLGVNYIDIYQFHGVSSKGKQATIFAPDGAMEGMEEVIKEGKVRFPGFSSHNIPIALEIMKTGKFASVQLPFNFIEEAALEKAIPYAKKLDMGFIAMKPMGGGLLDNATLAFRYLGQYDSVIPDPGFEKIEEIRQIVEIVESKAHLSMQDKRDIDKIRIDLGSSFCRRCDYCQGCPQGIHISLALGVRSAFKRMTPERARSFVGPAIEEAKTCQDCRKCVSKCPYHLNIPALLKENVKVYGYFSKS